MSKSSEIVLHTKELDVVRLYSTLQTENTLLLQGTESGHRRADTQYVHKDRPWRREKPAKTAKARMARPPPSFLRHRSWQFSMRREPSFSRSAPRWSEFTEQALQATIGLEWDS